MSLKDRHRSITVRGLVCATEWDGEGNPCRVSIFSFDEDEFEIEPHAAGAYLLGHTGEEVMVRGHLAPGFRRRKVVLVKTFTVFGTDSAETIEDGEDLLFNWGRTAPPGQLSLQRNEKWGSYESGSHLQSTKQDSYDDESVNGI